MLRTTVSPSAFSLTLAMNFSGDLKIDIGFEQRQANLAQRGVDVRLVDHAMSTKLFEDVLKFVARVVKT